MTELEAKFSFFLQTHIYIQNVCNMFLDNYKNIQKVKQY